MVSIIPGIETLAPERTETSNGFGPLPKVKPDLSCKFSMFSAICFWMLAGMDFLLAWYAVQASVVMVKPSGILIPMWAISAKPAPLPPNNGFPKPYPSPKA